jgi:plastocyanin
MKRAIFLTLWCVIIIAGLLGAVSCGSSSPTSTPTSTPTQTQGAAVNIQNEAFSPGTLTVAAGTTVTWTNNDAVVHTVTSDTGLFDSGQMSKGSHFSHTFSDKGTFQYHCTIHTNMHGTIIVQ